MLSRRGCPGTFSARSLPSKWLWRGVDSRPRIAENSQPVFRNDVGQPNIDKTLRLSLPLEDFAEQKTCRLFKDIDRDTFLSCDELHQYLEEAEAIAKMADSTQPEQSARLKKRRRTQTPEEQLDDRAEAALVEGEERVSKRQELDDASSEESSSECDQSSKD